MSYHITDELQSGCDTIKRSIIHCSYKDLNQSIDAIAFDTSTAPSVVENVLKGPLRRPDNPKYPSKNVSKDPLVAQRALSVPFRKVAPFQCLYSAKYIGDTYWRKHSLIFSNGPEDAKNPDTMASFTRGFVGLSSRPALLFFQGKVDFDTTTHMFDAIFKAGRLLAHENLKTSPRHLGGRGIGAIAAVRAVTEETTHLVLVGYPLQAEGGARDDLLRDLKASMNVLFVSGSLDGGCEELERVCKELNCRVWKIAIQEANKALEIESSETGTQEVAKMTGAVVARWLESCNEQMQDGKIVWNPDEGVARWSGWAWNLKDKIVDARDQDPKPAVKSRKQTSQSKGKRKSGDGDEKEDGSSAASKKCRKSR